MSQTTIAQLSQPYRPVHATLSRFVKVRGLNYHVWEWGHPSMASAQSPTVVLLHGWMDTGASFQFVVDQLKQRRHIVACDWRGFGQSEHLASDTYWFPDYIGDLDVLLDVLEPAHPIDLVGHSMGGNVATVYAGLRPQRLRSLVNLEGFGMPATKAEQAPGRFINWLDEIKSPPQLKDYASLADVAARMQKNNPRLTDDRARWLAAHWASEQPGGRWKLNADPAHKGSSPLLYHADEVLACWDRINVPVLWVEGEIDEVSRYWGTNYPREEFEARLKHLRQLSRAVIPAAGHMLHHDQPAILAHELEKFWAGV